MYRPEDLFDLSQTEHASIFDGCEYAWDALKKIKSYLAANLRPGLHHKADGPSHIGPNVFIGEGTVVEAGVMIKGPAIIGRNCQIRHNAYFREHVIVGDNCVVGNSCELKGALLFNNSQVPHFNYVGDSIIGYKAHLGAGVILSNVKLDHGEISVAAGDTPIATGLTKFGAIVGDRTEIGCNAVINPGSVLGRDCLVYPNVNFRGVLPEGSVVKLRQEFQILERRERGK